MTDWLIDWLSIKLSISSVATSTPPKVLQNAGILRVLTCKRAWRHSCVPFFGIGTSESGPPLRRFVHFDLKMRIATTGACLFSFLFWTATSAPAALASLLFRTSGTTNHWENIALPDLPNISRVCIFFLVTLYSRVGLLSSDLTSLLFFSTVHIVGS